MKGGLTKVVFKIIIGLVVIISLLISGLLVNRRIEQRTILSHAQEMIEAGGINEIREVTLGGIPQYIAIEGRNQENPLCLFIHGGPGLATPFGISARTHYPDLMSHCTVVYWDQRGAGKTYDVEMEIGLLTLSQLQKDAIELIHYLLKEFNQENLYIIGYSWGTVLGMRLTQMIPDQIEAYFGIGQVVEPLKSNRLLYEWLLKEYDRIGDSSMVLALKEIGLPPYTKKGNQAIFNKAVSQSGAYMKSVDGVAGMNIFKWLYQVWISPDLSLKEVYETLFKGSRTTLVESVLWTELSRINFNQEITEVKIPVYFISGVDDYICSKDLLLNWLGELKAPQKDTLILDFSAHYLSTEDELTMFEWIKSIINQKYPQEEMEEDELEESVISSLLNQS